MKSLLYFSAVLIAMLFGTTISAQFVTPITSITGDADIITVDGQKKSGKLKNAVSGTNGLISFKFEDKDGNKTKYKASNIQQLKIKVDGLAKIEIIADQSENITKLAKSNFKEVVDRDYIYWQRVKDPSKDKYTLLQLLNPGFDSRIKVYDLPNSKSGETTIDDIAVSGGEATAYMVVKDGNSMKITKKKYKKEGFNLLFGDCKLVVDECKPDFKQFATHVFIYDENCGSK